MNFRDASFENVIAITSIEFTSNPEKAITEAFRLLKKDGKFIIATLNKDGKYFSFRKNKAPYKYAKAFNYSSLQNCLSKYGYVEIKSCVVFDYDENDLSLIHI